jgi:diguanylate cyclase (GGDEF)-like protein
VVGERIRVALAALSVPVDNGSINVTASLGVAEKRIGTQSVDDMLHASDDALYEAKRSGRNRVVTAGQTTSSPTGTSAPDGATSLLVRT